MSDQFDPKDDGARMDFRKTMSYGDYLQIDKILDAQAPLSQAPDELLFIIQHQTSELWMKLLLHELADARAAIAADDLPPAFKLLARVSRILEQLNNAWDVLRTMTPSDYTTFRDVLGESCRAQVSPLLCHDDLVENGERSQDPGKPEPRGQDLGEGAGEDGVVRGVVVDVVVVLLNVLHLTVG